MTKRNQEQFARYESLRLQLAEVGRRFVEYGKVFPGVHFQFLQANYSMGSKGWSEWIEANRSDDDDRELWDVYPYSWARDDWTIEELADNEGLTSRFAGRYRCSLRNVEAAKMEFERLAVCGSKILFALRQECVTHERLNEFASFSSLSPGYRGWLDSVRNTGELHRSAYINVKLRMWGVEDDILSTCRAMAESNAETKESRRIGARPPNGVSTVEISPDIFAASAAAIRLWLQGELSETVEDHIMYDFDRIKITGTSKADHALTAIGVENNSVTSQKLAPRKIDKKRGRKLPGPESAALEKRIVDAWDTGNFPTYSECAKALSMEESLVRKVVPTVRRRQKRAAQNKK